ncbi:hypothetical protein [Clostridium perfringens]
MNKEISLKASLWYLIVAVCSVSLGRFLILYFSNNNIYYNLKLLILFIVTSIFCYVLSFKIIAKFSSNKIKINNFFLKVIPLYILLETIIGLILTKI